MLHYSFSTVYMAVLTSNLILILITILFRNHKMMINVGYKLLSLFVALTALRFVLPFEFPFTNTVFLKEFETLSMAITSVRKSFIPLGTHTFSLWDIFEMIWIIGFFINLIHYFRLHRKTRYFILANSLDVTEQEPYRSTLDRICRERSKKNPFRVLTVNGINTLMVYGIFTPHILIPEGLELPEEKWYYILSHEASHHFHHDLLIKTLTRFVTMVYWWNPASHILNKQVDVILEMRVDNIVAAYSQETIIKYLHCLTELGELALKKNVLPNAVTLSLLTAEDSSLIQRYHMLASAGKRKNLIINAGLFALIIGVYAASHLYIFEASYIPPEIRETTFSATADNCYAILKEDGTYDVYLMDLFIENVASLEYYPPEVPVYPESEFAGGEQ